MSPHAFKVAVMTRPRKTERSERLPRSSYKVSPDGGPPWGLTKEQTTETMDPSPKTKGLQSLILANEIESL